MLQTKGPTGGTAEPFNPNPKRQLWACFLGQKVCESYPYIHIERKFLVVVFFYKDRKMRTIKPGNPSVAITPEIAVKIKRLSKQGLYQHDIATLIGCNQGRISEVLRGKVYPSATPQPDLFV